MGVIEQPAIGDVETTAGTELRLRADGDRGCRYCGEVALVFDPTVDGPRCRVCGEID